MVDLLWHHSSNPKRNHRLCADSVLDLYDAILLGLKPVRISGEVNCRGTKLSAGLAAVSYYLLQDGWYNATILTAVAVRFRAYVWRIVPPVCWNGRATSAGSWKRDKGLITASLHLSIFPFAEVECMVGEKTIVTVVCVVFKKRHAPST